jgi:ribosome-binding protein aMBF1 (putative translation factor)
MDKRKRRRLEVAGWHFGTVQELLGLTDTEVAMIDMRIALVRCVREQRARSGLSQAELAERLGSSQSRIAKIEAGDRSVSFELMIRAALEAGADAAAVARAMAPKRRKARRVS